jgi:hypothetical protein
LIEGRKAGNDEEPLPPVRSNALDAPGRQRLGLSRRIPENDGPGLGRSPITVIHIRALQGLEHAHVLQNPVQLPRKRLDRSLIKAKSSQRCNLPNVTFRNYGLIILR